MTYEAAKEYLSRVLPWPEEGEAPSFCNIHWTFQSENFARPGWGGRAVKTVDEAVKALEFALKNNTTKDIYACLSSQAVATPKTTKTGWTYNDPQRAQKNAVALKSLFLDIDCKDEKGYPDQKSAVAALAEFLKASKMPRPTLVVSSGNGLHVYWTLKQPLAPDEWRPRAFALAEATKQLGLKADTQCTIDSARILRVPDTFNRKGKEPKAVRLIGARVPDDYDLDVLDKALAPFKKAISTVLAPRNTKADANDELSAGITTNKAPPADINALGDACPFVKEAIDTGGADFSNPLWNLTTLIGTFCEDGREAAHIMAKGHSDYQQETTDQLYDRKLRTKEEQGLGWPHCSTISGSGCLQCMGCPHKTKGKTPFHFIAPPPPPVPPPNGPKPKDWDLPQGYVRDGDYKINKVLVNQDGTTDLIPVLNYPMRDPWLQRNPWVLNFNTTVGHETVNVDMLWPEVQKQGGSRAILGQYGIALRPGRASLMFEEFMSSWMEKLQSVKNVVVQSSPFGWQVNRQGNIEGFTFQEQWTPTGSKPCSAGDPILASAYTPRGKIEAWKKAAKLVTDQKKPALDAVLASAFGAPLVKFIGQEGVMMSLWSAKSGIGKSTALKTACAVWGDPKKAMAGLSDTSMSVTNKMSQLKALPMYWDELKTEEDTRRFVNLVFQLGSGRDKSRMTSDIKQRDTGSWQTMLISASNESIIDYVVGKTKMSLAGVYRVFEYEISEGISTGLIETADADKIIGKLNDNYGWAGLEYSKWLGENFLQIEADCLQCRKEVDIEANIPNDQRMWSVLITAILMGARYSNQLGLTQIDEVTLKEFMFAKLEDMRRYINKAPNDMTKSDNVENVLAQYLDAMRARHTLWTDTIHLGRGQPQQNAIQIKRDTTRLESVCVHIGIQSRILRISSSSFSEWLGIKGYTRQVFMRALEEQFGGKVIKCKLGGGTQYASFQQYAIEIQLSGTPLDSFLGTEESVEGEGQ